MRNGAFSEKNEQKNETKVALTHTCSQQQIKQIYHLEWIFGVEVGATYG